jgi:hypothetical protein
LSISRGIIFVVMGIFILPIFFPTQGIWGSILFAEVVTFLLAIFLLFSLRQKQTNLFLEANTSNNQETKSNNEVLI